MSRNEFATKTRREALKRSGMLCEAVGTWYGLDAGQRCGSGLSQGVEYDHIILDANSKDNSLENCAAVCIPCHRIKTAKHDVPLAAKTKRQADARYVAKPAGKIPSAPFQSSKPERTGKTPLAPKVLFRSVST